MNNQPSKNSYLIDIYGNCIDSVQRRSIRDSHNYLVAKQNKRNRINDIVTFTIIALIFSILPIVILYISELQILATEI